MSKGGWIALAFVVGLGFVYYRNQNTSTSNTDENNSTDNNNTGGSTKYLNENAGKLIHPTNFGNDIANAALNLPVVQQKSAPGSNNSTSGYSFSAAEVFTSHQFAGNSASLGPGYYNEADLIKLGINSYNISSVNIIPGYQLILYRYPNFGGDRLVMRNIGPKVINQAGTDITKYLSDLSKVNSATAALHFQGSWDKGAGSLVVGKINDPSQATLPTVYTDILFGGGSATLDVGQYDVVNFKNKGIGNDSISSLKVPKGYKVTLYWDSGFGEPNTVFNGNADQGYGMYTTDVPSLLGVLNFKNIDNGEPANWNDQVSSIIVTKVT